MLRHAKFKHETIFENSIYLSTQQVLDIYVVGFRYPITTYDYWASNIVYNLNSVVTWFKITLKNYSYYIYDVYRQYLTINTYAYSIYKILRAHYGSFISQRSHDN